MAKESVVEFEKTEYKKDHITFVLRDLPIKSAHRWVKFCEDWGLKNKHQAAFELALNILEGKAQNLMNIDSRILNVEKLLQTHDDVLQQIINSNEQEEDIDLNEQAKLNVIKRKQRLEESRKNEQLAKKEAEKNDKNTH